MEGKGKRDSSLSLNLEMRQESSRDGHHNGLRVCPISEFQMFSPQKINILLVLMQ